MSEGIPKACQLSEAGKFLGIPGKTVSTIIKAHFREFLGKILQDKKGHQLLTADGIRLLRKLLHHCNHACNPKFFKHYPRLTPAYYK
ncbi:MAG: hypothetical protein PHW04_04255 [Candidatus Wallbacteria bacterium]|nr:hypothetical protein [Candidatus Wallbacteria bacterium]